MLKGELKKILPPSRILLVIVFLTVFALINTEITRKELYYGFDNFEARQVYHQNLVNSQRQGVLELEEGRKRDRMEGFAERISNSPPVPYIKTYHQALYRGFMDLWKYLIIIGFLVSGIFPMEHEYKTLGILLAARKSKLQIVMSKLLAGAITVIFVVVMDFIIAYFFSSLMLGGRAQGTIRQVMYFGSSPWNISLAQLPFISIVLAFISGLLIAFFTMLISSMSKYFIVPMVITLTVGAVPIHTWARPEIRKYFFQSYYNLFDYIFDPLKGEVLLPATILVGYMVLFVIGMITFFNKNEVLE